MLVLFVCIISAARMIVCEPEIKVTRVEPPIFMEEYGTVPADGILDLKVNVTAFELTCCANYPITWEYVGFQSPLQLNVTTRRTHLPDDRLSFLRFEVSLNFIRISAEVTGNYTCRALEEVKGTESEGIASVHIYGQSHQYRGKDPDLLLFGQSVDISVTPDKDVFLLPCAVWNTKAEVKLYRRNEDKSGFIEIQTSPTLTYDPRTGFSLLQKGSEFQLGLYICATNFSATYDRVRIRLIKPEFQVWPEKDVIEVTYQSNSSVGFNVKCLSTHEVRIEGAKEDETVNVTSGPNLDPMTSNLFGFSSRLNFTHITLENDGQLRCVDVKTEKVLHAWNYEVIDKFSKERRGWKHFYSRRTRMDTYACWAKTSNLPSVGFVTCTNPVECGIRSQCFKKKNRCDSVNAKTCPGGCVLLNIEQQPGILKCDGDGLDDTVEKSRLTQFVGISGLPYTEMTALKNAKNGSEVLKIKCSSDSGTVLQAKTELFTCVGSTFLFSGGFQWYLYISEGDSPFILHQGSRRYESIAEIISHKERYLPTGHIQVESEIRINATGIKSVYCIAPLWNAKTFENRSVGITVEKTTAPSRISKLNASQSVQFTAGSTHNTLNCSVIGNPKPEIFWYRNNVSIPKTVEANETLLIFSEVLLSHSGMYTCMGKNFLGSIISEFQVTVDREQTQAVNQDLMIGFSTAACIGVFVLVIVSVVFWKRIQRQKKLLRQLTEEEIAEFELGNPEALNTDENTNNQGHLLAYNMAYEFPKENLDIHMNDKLGSGAFGVVVKGFAKGIYTTEELSLVAVKTIKPNAEITYFKALLMELKIMSRIGRHPNIVNLLGACTRDIRKREVFIIVEFCGNGNLENYLRTHRQGFDNIFLNSTKNNNPPVNPAMYENSVEKCTLSTGNLLTWSYQIAYGMEYLASRKVIHGDLATRNVLLTDSLFAKIGDFGLSRQMYSYSNYVKKNQSPLPWRWMALESLRDMEFSSKSDVWAFGVTLWEIFSLAEVPYPGINWTQEFMDGLTNGDRLPCPHKASDALYNLMIDCWRVEPGDRPTFPELVEAFRAYLKRYNIPNQEPPAINLRTNFITNFEDLKLTSTRISTI